MYPLSAAPLLAALLDQLDARHRLHLSQSFKVKGNKPCQMYVYDPFCEPTACGWTFETHFLHPQPVDGRLKNILCSHSLWMDAWNPFCAPTACGWMFETRFALPQPVGKRSSPILRFHSLWVNVRDPYCAPTARDFTFKIYTTLFRRISPAGGG